VIEPKDGFQFEFSYRRFFVHYRKHLVLSLVIMVMWYIDPPFEQVMDGYHKPYLGYPLLVYLVVTLLLIVRRLLNRAPIVLDLSQSGSILVIKGRWQSSFSSLAEIDFLPYGRSSQRGLSLVRHQNVVYWVPDWYRCNDEERLIQRLTEFSTRYFIKLRL